VVKELRSLAEIHNLLNFVVVLPERKPVLLGEHFDELVAGAGNTFPNHLVRSFRAAAKFGQHHKPHGRMLNFDPMNLFADAIFLHYEIFRADIQNEVSILILHQQLQSRGVACRIEMNFCFLRTLLALEDDSIQRRSASNTTSLLICPSSPAESPRSVLLPKIDRRRKVEESISKSCHKDTMTNMQRNASYHDCACQLCLVRLLA
jgi:hypothetical protein